MRLVLLHAVAEPARKGRASHLHGAKRLPSLRHLAHGRSAHGGHGAVHACLVVLAPVDPAHGTVHGVPVGVDARPLGVVCLRHEVCFTPNRLNVNLEALLVEARGAARRVAGSVAGLVHDQHAAHPAVVRHVARLALGVELHRHVGVVLVRALVDLEGAVVGHHDLLDRDLELHRGEDRAAHGRRQDPLPHLRDAGVGHGEGVAD
mmetsp:Transcript_30999/g.60567  ORF Transcript_30999/g.60567 Transcript_30999/m.60567 type:complete len:205 (-) Transcript_30999:552-1166(-)